VAHACPGRRVEGAAVWETEESYPMCSSRRGRRLLAELVRLHRETGSPTTSGTRRAVRLRRAGPRPRHGGEHAAGARRRLRLPDRAAARGDRGEAGGAGSGRSRGLRRDGRRPRGGAAFLTAGRYFLVNNGPYYQSYDIPIDPRRKLEPLLPQGAGPDLDHPLDLRLRQVDPGRALPHALLPDDPEDAQLVGSPR